jgi:Type II restriction endonuclease EcoO109I
MQILNSLFDPIGMKGIFMSSSKIENLVRQKYDEFYRQRLLILTGATLSDLLHKQNLYLLCVTRGSSASKIVEKMLAEYIASFDENIFGQTFLESIVSIEREPAAFSNEKSHAAYKVIALLNLMRNYSAPNRREYDKEWAKALNRFENDFLNNFGNPDGSIDWEKLLRYNSGKDNVPWVSKVIPVTSAEDQEDESNDDEAGDIDDGTEGYE